MKIRKGDRVIVRAGRDKGQTGEVIKVFRDKNRVVVNGVNIYKRHTRPSAGNAGGIVETSMPIHVSNVALLDPKDAAKPTRVSYKFLKDGSKVRVAQRSGEVIS
ncbi:MAG: 50S ribosomal protein L24 [Pseudomonadota bacterium]